MLEKIKSSFFLDLFILFIILLISIPAILPYFHKGYFPTHDGEWAVVRLTDMFRELRDFQVPARFSGNLNFGYGYPLFNFAYPLPYYLGIAIYFVTNNFIDSIKLMFAISVPLSGIFMYFASRTLWQNSFAGFISAIFYMYFPYRFVDLYVRGSLGESLAFVFFAALFFFIIKIDQTGKPLWIGLGALSYGFLILTHNIMAVLFSLFLVLYVLGNLIFKKSQKIFSIILALVLGLGISSFFWLPALVEKQYILLSKIPIADRDLYYVSLSKLLFPSWGYGVPTDSNGFTYQIGIPQLLVIVCVIVFFAFVFKTKPSVLRGMPIRIGFVFLVTFFFLASLMFKPAALFWKLPLLSEINYPWTLLSVLGFIVSFLGGFLAIYTRYTAMAIAVLAFIFCLPYAKPEYYVNRGDMFYLTNDATTTSSKELMPLWVKQMPLQQASEKVSIIKGKGTIKDLTFNSKEIKFTAELDQPSTIRVNTIYFPGWVIQNGNTISYNNPQGVMEFSEGKGTHNIHFVLKNTFIQSLGNSLSLISIIVLLFVLLTSKMPFLRNKLRRLIIFYM